MLGVLTAYLAYNPDTKAALSMLLKKMPIRIGMLVLALGLFLLIVLMPSVWQQSLGL